MKDSETIHVHFLFRKICNCPVQDELRKNPLLDDNSEVASGCLPSDSTKRRDVLKRSGPRAENCNPSVLAESKLLCVVLFSFLWFGLVSRSDFFTCPIVGLLPGSTTRQHRISDTSPAE